MRTYDRVDRLHLFARAVTDGGQRQPAWRARAICYNSRPMKAGTLATIGAGLAVVATAFAVHFELSARSRVDRELRGLRVEATTDLSDHRITPSQAAAIERRLAQAQRQIEDDNVRKAQMLLHGVKADLKSGSRPV